MRIAVTILMMLALTVGRVYGDNTDQPPPTPDQEQPEVLTSGPVHEAFAEPVSLEVQAGLVAPEEPPARIQEVPPTDRPQGDQFVWVPAYWAWDADRHVTSGSAPAGAPRRPRCVGCQAVGPACPKGGSGSLVSGPRPGRSR